MAASVRDAPSAALAEHLLVLPVPRSGCGPRVPRQAFLAVVSLSSRHADILKCPQSREWSEVQRRVMVALPYLWSRLIRFDLHWLPLLLHFMRPKLVPRGGPVLSSAPREGTFL